MLNKLDDGLLSDVTAIYETEEDTASPLSEHRHARTAPGCITSSAYSKTAGRRAAVRATGYNAHKWYE